MNVLELLALFIKLFFGYLCRFILFIFYFLSLVFNFTLTLITMTLDYFNLVLNIFPDFLRPFLYAMIGVRLFRFILKRGNSAFRSGTVTNTSTTMRDITSNSSSSLSGGSESERYN